MPRPTAGAARGGVALVAALAALTAGTVLGYGSPGVGVALMLVALAGIILACAWPPGGGHVVTLLVVVLFAALLVLLTQLPLWWLLAAAAAGAGYTFARDRPWWWIATVPAAVLQVAVLVGQWHWGRAAIDVFTTLQTATEHLLQGANPYVFRYQDLDPVPKWHLVTAPFQYGPAALYLGGPGRLVGDVRLLAAVAALATVVALIAIARRGSRAQLQRTAFLASSLPLFGPVVVNAWVDVYTAAGLAIWWALRDRRWILGAAALGVGAAAKPVMLAGLAPLLVWDRNVRRDAAVAAVVAVVLCLPFVIWTGPQTFIYDVAGVHVQVLNAVWPTSVTIDALLHQAGLAPIPDVVSILVLLLSLPLALVWKPARRDVQLLVASAFMVTALLLSRQSFLNYYFVVAVWMLLALAEQPLEDASPAGTQPHAR